MCELCAYQTKSVDIDGCYSISKIVSLYLANAKEPTFKSYTTNRIQKQPISSHGNIYNWRPFLLLHKKQSLLDCEFKTATPEALYSCYCSFCSLENGVGLSAFTVLIRFCPQWVLTHCSARALPLRTLEPVLIPSLQYGCF